MSEHEDSMARILSLVVSTLSVFIIILLIISADKGAI